MAVKLAVQSADWSNPTTWGGAPPVAGDIVMANGFIITVDVSFTVAALKNTAENGAAQGGRFVVTAAATLNVTGGIAHTDNAVTNLAFITLSIGAFPVTITSPTIASGRWSGQRAIEVVNGYTGALVINGALQSDGQGTTINGLGSPSSITVNGDLSGYGYCIYQIQPTTINIFGNVTALTGYTIYVSGAVININITGNMVSVTGYPMRYIATGNVVINGNVTSGSGYIWMQTGYLTVRGKIKAGTAPAIDVGASVSAARVSGRLVCSGVEEASTKPGIFPISGAFNVIEGEVLDIYLMDDTNFPTGAGDSQRYALGDETAGGTHVTAPDVPAILDRAVGTNFAVGEDDEGNALLVMPATLDQLTQMDETIAQLNYVFGYEANELGWLTVQAKGVMALADTSDPGGAVDYIPVAGTVVLSPSTTRPLRLISTVEMLMLAPITATFDSNGKLSFDGIQDVRIVAPLWTELSNTAWKWNADVRPGAGQGWPAFTGSFTGAPGDIIDLATLIS